MRKGGRGSGGGGGCECEREEAEASKQLLHSEQIILVFPVGGGHGEDVGEVDHADTEMGWASTIVHKEERGGVEAEGGLGEEPVEDLLDLGDGVVKQGGGDGWVGVAEELKQRRVEVPLLQAVPPPLVVLVVLVLLWTVHHHAREADPQLPHGRPCLLLPPPPPPLLAVVLPHTRAAHLEVGDGRLEEAMAEVLQEDVVLPVHFLHAIALGAQGGQPAHTPHGRLIE